jgi:anti-anti-sigma regulatory factor
MEGGSDVDHTYLDRFGAQTWTAVMGHSPRGALTIREEPDEPLDVRLHAPSPDTVIVWVAGPLRRSTAPLLILRVRQQLNRASHVIIDLSSVRCLDTHAATELRTLCAEADRCGTHLHIAGVSNDAIADLLRHVDLDQHLATGPADAVLASLAITPHAR